MNTNDRRVQKTKRAIKSAFMELFSEKPLSSITVSELARKADIDRRTFYLHYESVTDIISEIEMDLTNQISQNLEKQSVFDIQIFFECLNQIMNDNLVYYRRISEDNSYYGFQIQCKNIFKTTMKETKYAYSNLSEEEFDINCEYVASGIIGVYTHWLRSHSDMSLERLTELAIEAVSVGWSKLMG